MKGLTCSKCKEKKSPESFSRRTASPRGYLYNCKSCMSKHLKKYRKATGEARRAKMRIWYKENREEISAKRSAKRVGKRDIINAQTKAWRARNPEAAKASSFTTTSQRRTPIEAGASVAEVADWARSQEKLCFYCGIDCQIHYHIDHFYPLSRGGEHIIENLRIACAPCNLRKHAKSPERFLRELANDPRRNEQAMAVSIKVRHRRRGA